MVHGVLRGELQRVLLEVYSEPRKAAADVVEGGEGGVRGGGVGVGGSVGGEGGVGIGGGDAQVRGEGEEAGSYAGTPTTAAPPDTPPDGIPPAGAGSR